MNIALPSLRLITRPLASLPVLVVTGRDTLALRAGTVIDGTEFPDETPVGIAEPLVAGVDYAIAIEAGAPVARPCGHDVPAGAIGGFHFAPGGNAPARAGGYAIPAINPASLWDAGFRPACADPRGMALVTQLGRRFWCDIYLLGVDHLTLGTSRHGVTIADGRSLPQAPDGKGRTKKLDYPTAVAIYAHHGKALLTYDEFRSAAFGATERGSADKDPVTTGLDAARTSQAGIMQATGNLWVWGTDGDPDDARPSIFGGSWISGDAAGSRYAYLGYWPDDSRDFISARGRCDHLNPA